MAPSGWMRKLRCGMVSYARFHAMVAVLVLSAALQPRLDAGHDERIREHWPGRVGTEILAVQQDIVRADGAGHFYDTSYRQAEPFYWWLIPLWMQEDAAHHRVRRILDVGCGYGTLLAVAAVIYGADGYCADVTPYLLPAVAAKRSLRFAQGNIEFDPIPWEGAFDVIIMTEVLEHLNFQPVPTLRKLRDALTPGGLLFLSTPDAREWGSTHKYYKRLEDIPAPVTGKARVDDHVWQYTETELRRVLGAAGFSIVRWGYAPGAGLRHFNVVLERDK